MTITDSSTGSGADPGADAPILAGIHHLKLPVTDLARSLEWYRSRLGYQLQIEFVEQGTLMGCAMTHPAGGPDLALRLDRRGLLGHAEQRPRALHDLPACRRPGGDPPG